MEEASGGWEVPVRALSIRLDFIRGVVSCRGENRSLAITFMNLSRKPNSCVGLVWRPKLQKKTSR